jgi:hypothetical protein
LQPTLKYMTGVEVTSVRVLFIGQTSLESVTLLSSLLLPH